MDPTDANEISDAAAASRRTGLLFVAAGALLALAGANPWWHVIGYGEPPYVKLSRVAVVLGGLAVLLAAFLPRFRSRALPVAGLLAALLPILMIQYIVTRDPLTMDRVDMQTRQANWLLVCLQHTEDLPYVPWVEPKVTTASANRANVYNIFDGFETIPVFAKAGWYLSIVAGVAVLIVALFLYGPEIRRWVFRYRGGIAVAAIAITLFFYAGPFAAFLYWNRARAAGASGDYAQAIFYDQQIPKVDPRWNYDMLYHGEIGRMYGHLGLTKEPDYWMFVADGMMKGGRYKAAMMIYQRHFGGNMSRGVRMRYIHTLVVLGAQDFRVQRVGEAVDLWRRAASLDPDNVEALYFEAFGFTKVGRYGEAVPVWKALIGKNESVGMYRMKYFANRRYRKQITSRAWNLLGWCYFQLGDYSSAIHCRYNSLQAGPTDVNALPDSMSVADQAPDPVDGADPTGFASADE